MASCILATNRPTVHRAAFLTSSEAATLCGLSFMSINRAFDRGELGGHRLPSGHRRIDRASLVEWAGVTDEGAEQQDEQPEQSEGLTVLYARCSTDKQADNLARQCERLEQWAAENYPGETVLTLKELASGINSDRKQLNRLIDLALQGKVKRLVLEFSERLSRGSYGLLSRILEKCGVEIVLTRQDELEQETKSLTDELICDCVAMMTSVGAKINGRKASQKIRFVASPELEARIATLYGAGQSKRQIIATVVKEGHRCLNTNNLVGEWGIRKVIAGLKAMAPAGQPVPECVQSFIRTTCVVNPTKRTKTSDLWQAFSKQFAAEASSFTSRKFVDTLKSVVPNVRIERQGGGHLLYGMALRG